MHLICKPPHHKVHTQAFDASVSYEICKYFCLSNEIPSRLSALFQQFTPPLHTQASPPHHRAGRPWSGNISSIKVMTCHRSGGLWRGRMGVRRGAGANCFDLSEICALTKTTEISMLALPPIRPSLTLAWQLNPSLCAPHSCMDLSAMGQGQWGVDRVMITKQVFPGKRKGQLTQALHWIISITQVCFTNN